MGRKPQAYCLFEPRSLYCKAKFPLITIDAVRKLTTSYELEPLTAATRNDLTEIMGNLHEQSAISILSQLSTDQVSVDRR